MARRCMTNGENPIRRRPMQSIVVGYDETEPSKRALDRAAEIAKAFGAKLIVTSVAPVMVSPGRGADAGAIDPTDTPVEHVAELAHAREQLAARASMPSSSPRSASRRRRSSS